MISPDLSVGNRALDAYMVPERKVNLGLVPQPSVEYALLFSQWSLIPPR